MDITDRVLDIAEDMACLELYFSQLLGWSESDRKDAYPPEPPSFHDGLLSEQVEQISKCFVIGATRG